MKPKLMLTIGGVLAVLFGLALTFAPDAMMTRFGLKPDAAGAVLSRDLGVTLVAIGAMNLLARNAGPGPALSAILWANLLVQAFQIFTDAYHITSGQIASSGWGGVGLHVVLGAGFALALARPDKAL